MRAAPTKAALPKVRAGLRRIRDARGVSEVERARVAGTMARARTTTRGPVLGSVLMAGSQTNKFCPQLLVMILAAPFKKRSEPVFGGVVCGEGGIGGDCAGSG